MQCIHSSDQFPISGFNGTIVGVVNDDFDEVPHHQLFNIWLLERLHVWLVIDLQQPDFELFVDHKVITKHFKAVFRMVLQLVLDRLKATHDDLLNPWIDLVIPGIRSVFAGKFFFELGQSQDSLKILVVPVIVIFLIIKLVKIVVVVVVIIVSFLGLNFRSKSDVGHVCFHVTVIRVIRAVG